MSLIPRQRARELMPQMQLTLLSIIQALALEILWSRTMASPHLFEGGLVAIGGWLQFAAIVQGIVLNWLLYVGMVMRFVWVPKTRDSILPFGIGLLEFAVIELSGPEHPVAWLLMMSAIFAVATFASSNIYARVLAEPENRDLALELEPPGRDVLFPAVFIALLWLAAAAVALAGGYGGLAVAAFALTNAVLLAQSWIVHRYAARALGRTAPVPRPEEA